MWDILQQHKPDLQKLMETCHENFLAIERTNQMYKQLIALNSYSLHLKNFIEIYAGQIIYDEVLVAQVQKDITIVNQMEVGNSVRQELDLLLKKYNIYDDNTAVLAISSKKDSMSMITWSS